MAGKDLRMPLEQIPLFATDTIFISVHHPGRELVRL
jgi:hypothetical protein